MSDADYLESRMTSNLRHSDAEEHGQRIDGGVGDRGRMRARDRVGEGERRRICHAACLQAKDGQVIQLEDSSAEDAGCQDRDHRDRDAADQPKQTARR